MIRALKRYEGQSVHLQCYIMMKRTPNKISYTSTRTSSNLSVGISCIFCVFVLLQSRVILKNILTIFDSVDMMY